MLVELDVMDGLLWMSPNSPGHSALWGVQLLQLNLGLFHFRCCFCQIIYVSVWFLQLVNYLFCTGIYSYVFKIYLQLSIYCCVANIWEETNANNANLCKKCMFSPTSAVTVLVGMQSLVLPHSWIWTGLGWWPMPSSPCCRELCLTASKNAAEQTACWHRQWKGKRQSPQYTVSTPPGT